MNMGNNEKEPENDTLEKVIAEMRNLGKFDEESTDKIPRTLMGLGFRTYADRLEAIAKRAYNDIDSVVCGIEDASHYDIDDVRKAMKETIGDYYE